MSLRARGGHSRSGGAQDLGDTTTGDATDSQSLVQGREAGGDVRDLNRRGRSLQLTYGLRPPSLLDGSDRHLQFRQLRFVLFRAQGCHLLYPGY